MARAIAGIYPPCGSGRTAVQPDVAAGPSGRPYRVDMPGLPIPTPPLADEVVRLRPWRATDLTAMFRAFSDPVVQRFSWPRLAPYTEADARAYLVEQERGRLRGRQ